MRTRLAQLNNQHGAATAMVAISLIAVMGMVVLVVDVGGLLTLRRRMVAATDAAALAAAQSCARNLTGEVLTQADQLATDNVAQAQRHFFEEEGCGGGTGKLTVGYRANQKLFFAPLLGVDDSSPVGHTSTAIWGPAQGGNSMPLRVDLDPASGTVPCVVGTEFPAECNIWFDNTPTSSEWGFVNFNLWGVDRNANCNSGGGANDLNGWIEDGGVEKLMETVPTYVCRRPGHVSNTWRDSLTEQIGNSFLFPVSDPSLAGPQTYAIVGFTKLRIEAVLQGDDPEAVGTPGVAGDSATCVAQRNMTTNLVIALWTLSGANCPGGAPPDAITNLQLTRRVGRTDVTIPPSFYSYDPTDQELTWLGPRLNRVRISFDWIIQGTPATPGRCGVRERDPNAACIVLVWEGPTIGGYTPGPEGTRDFGVRAIRLAETD